MENVNTDQVNLGAAYHPQSYITLKTFKDGADYYYNMSASQVESHIKSNEYNTRILSQLQSNVKALEEYLVEHHEELDADLLSDLQNIFDLTLEKTINVVATVEFSMEITVPLHEVDDFEVNDYDFDFEVNSYKHSIDRADSSLTDWSVD